MLPPNFELKSTHPYGILTLLIHSIRTPQVSLVTVEPHFFGKAKHISSPIKLPISFEYTVATNLWHFYSYLTDCRSITLIFTAPNNSVYSAQIPLQLLPSSQVLNNRNASIDYLFKNNSYLLTNKQSINLYDRNHKQVGSSDIEVKLSFDEQIHKILYSANVVEFDDILVIDEISPIPSSIDLQNSILEIQQKCINPPQQSAIQPIQQESYQPLILVTPKQEKPFNQSQQLDVKETYPMEDDQKMLEDDIDRLIAEMQNKPYDSSRYVENNQCQQSNRKENVNTYNYTPHHTSTEKRQHSNKGSCEKLPPKYPTSVKLSQSSSQPFQPIFSYTASNNLPSNRVNYLMNTSDPSLISTQRSKSRQQPRLYDSKIGVIKLKIHEFIMQRQESQTSLLLKLFLNDSSIQFYSANSLKQGETVTFNSTIKIDQKININQLRFQLIDSFDMKTIFAQGVFEMKRLFDQNPPKGIFMVNLTSPQPNRPSSSSKLIRVDEQQLVRVIPNPKSLRIQLQYEQPIEIVQIYLHLSEFNSLCKVCRYKIPMTKETIQFRMSELPNNKHVNIFPHNRSSSNQSGQKIIVQLWGETELIGLSQISLKPLYNTNQRMINSSLEPIYLLDQTREVNDLTGGKTKGSFKVRLCYGTISQVQSLLNQNSKKQFRGSPKKSIEVESHLGIYVKQNKTKRQVQIQVDELSQPASVVQQSNISRKTELNLMQQQELPEEDEQQQAQISAITKDGNEFLNQTMQEKFMNKDTVPFIIKNQYLPKSGEHSQTYSNFTKTTHEKRILQSLTKQFQQLIKQTLETLSNDKIFQELKNQCKEHLLYNFIEVNVLESILQSLGVPQVSIDTIFNEILSHSNSMANVNLLYDLIYGLILEGQVKEKYIDDSLMGRYCLSELYKNIKKQQISELQNFIMDENIQFQEARKAFETIGFKLTLRQFRQIEQFQKKFQYENSSLSIKKTLLTSNQNKRTKQEQIKQHQKQVEAKIYNKYQWDEEDDFFISNINQPANHSEAPSSTQYFLKTEETSSKIQSTTFPHLNEKTISPAKNLPISRLQAQPGTVPILVAQKPTHKIIIEGFQNCIEATQCHLNVHLLAPQLKVIYNRSLSAQSEILLDRQKGKQSYQIDVVLPAQEDFLDGCISMLNKAQVIAKCNFSIIKGVRSVYALKSLKQSQFCGLIYLQFSCQ